MRKKLLLILINLFIGLVFGEVIFRIFPQLHQKPPPYDTAELDQELGWRQKADYFFEGEQKSLNGVPYPVRLQFGRDGFRYLPEDSTGNRQKIFIIGDSFTQAIEVSNGKAWYDHLPKDNYQVFVYGMAGYGTLQAYMILDQYIDQIQPDIVIFQSCSNDFLDNQFDLEKAAAYRVSQRRPYYQLDQSISYGLPLGFWESMIRYSKFLGFVWDKALRIKMKLGIQRQNTSEALIAEKGEAYVLYKKSKEITALLLQKIKDRTRKNLRLLFMHADRFEPQQQDFAQLCKKAQIDFIPFPHENMDSLRLQRETYTLDGYHWNEHGHRLIGQNLQEYLLKPFPKSDKSPTLIDN